MADYQYTEFPIDADEIDIDQLQQDVQNVTDDILSINQALESINQRITALTNRTINGYDLSADRTLFAQDIPSKNLLPNTASTQTINGVTFTVNEDGSVTVSGTASADAIFYLESENIEIPAGSYVITSGQLSGASFTTHCLVWGSHSEYSNNGAFTLSSAESGRAYIKIASGQSFNGTFYPMIRLASIEDATYVPYAKTNVELTEYLTTDTTTVSSDYGSFSFRRFGRIVMCQWGSINTVTLSAWSSVNLCEIPAKFRPATYAYYFLPRQAETTFIPVYIAATSDNNYLRLFNQSGQSQTTGRIINGLCMWINKAT